MNSNIEKEYKVLVNKIEFYTLLEEFKSLDMITRIQQNTYYDTKENSIRNRRGAMRIRSLNDMYIFTLKIPSSQGLLEYEKEVPANDISVFEDKEIKELLSSYQIYGPIQQLCVLTTERSVFNNGYAELCFDANMYNGIYDYELEYEYLKDHDGLATFQRILDKIGITYTENCKSKIERALESL